MSISEKRLAANRANAAKSTGPRTPPGKAASARNSIRHGILANTIVLDGESLERFTALIEGLYLHFQPVSEVEFSLVENMAAARWRQMRIWGLEKAGLSREIRKQLQNNEEAKAEDAPTQTAIAFRALCDQSRTLDLLNRYENRFDIQYNRSLLRLNDLRRHRGQLEIAA